MTEGNGPGERDAGAATAVAGGLLTFRMSRPREPLRAVIIRVKRKPLKNQGGRIRHFQMKQQGTDLAK
jgi:hypothetical protein